jgi:hypothetical protein
MPPVTIRVLSDEPSPAPVQGVLVEFYNLAAVFQTLGVSDSAGEVTVILPDATYDVFLYKVGVNILPKQPQRIVVNTALVNTFEITGHVRTLPESFDSLRCTVSGYVLGVNGKNAKHRLIFELCPEFMILNKNIIAPLHRFEVSSNESGYFEFELLRNAHYTAYFLFPEDFLDLQPGQLSVITPDGPAISLDDLLFPVPIDFDFSVNTITLASGDPPDETTTFELTFSDGSLRPTTLSSPWAYVQLTNSDAAVVDASLTGNKVCLTPIGPGTATITTVRSEARRVVIDPMPTYVTESLVVTVT